MGDGTFTAAQLISVLNIVDIRWPDARLVRSRPGTGNLCVLQNGEYRALIELHDPPELTDFDEPDS